MEYVRGISVRDTQDTVWEIWQQLIARAWSLWTFPINIDEHASTSLIYCHLVTRSRRSQCFLQTRTLSQSGTRATWRDTKSQTLDIRWMVAKAWTTKRIVETYWNPSSGKKHLSTGAGFRNHPRHVSKSGEHHSTEASSCSFTWTQRRNFRVRR